MRHLRSSGLQMKGMKLRCVEVVLRCTDSLAVLVPNPKPWPSGPFAPLGAQSLEMLHPHWGEQCVQPIWTMVDCAVEGCQPLGKPNTQSRSWSLPKEVRGDTAFAGRFQEADPREPGPQRADSTARLQAKTAGTPGILFGKPATRGLKRKTRLNQATSRSGSCRNTGLNTL